MEDILQMIVDFIFDFIDIIFNIGGKAIDFFDTIFKGLFNASNWFGDFLDFFGGTTDWNVIQPQPGIGMTPDIGIEHLDPRNFLPPGFEGTMPFAPIINPHLPLL